MKGPGLIRVVLSFIIIVIILILVTCHPVIRELFRTQKAIYSVPIKEKLVALTYDDGPHPVYTLQTLKILEKHHIRATFFMIGDLIQKYPAIAKQVAFHHVIGNHTFSHPANIKKFTTVQIMQELNKCDQVVENITGIHTHIFRPPRGLINAKVLTMVHSKGYQTVLLVYERRSSRRAIPNPNGKEFGHGPFELVDEGYMGIVLAPEGLTYEISCKLAFDIAEKEVGRLCLLPIKKPSFSHNKMLPVLLDPVEEFHAPIMDATPLHLIANYLAEVKNLEAGKYRWSSKNYPFGINNFY